AAPSRPPPPWGHSARAPAPGEDGGHREIPDRADNCSRPAGQPPSMARGERVGGKTDICDRRDPADQTKNARLRSMIRPDPGRPPTETRGYRIPQGSTPARNAGI